MLPFLITIGTPAAISILLTGILIDKSPHHLGNIISIGLFGSSIFLALDIIMLKFEIGLLVLIVSSILAAFMAILTVSSNVYFGYAINWSQRGKVYSLAILGFELLSLFFIIVTQILESDFFLAFSAYSIIGFILGLIFHYHNRNNEFWTNDQWPTKTIQIITRSSVNVYFWSHSLIYLMIGLMIGSLAGAGEELGITTFFGIELGAYKTFWASVMLGAALFILIGGYLTDKLGRKTAIILAAYGIVFASIIVGLLKETELNSFAFLFGAIIIGISFAFVHPSLDSSIWADLASQDSIGRYYYLGFTSLVLGLITGLTLGIISIEIFKTQLLIFNVFFLIVVAVLASLPLFWTSDSSPPLFFYLLLLINDAGMPIFHYDFKRTQDLKVDLPLISGALSAVGSFMLEATGEVGARLNLVRHGSNFILSDKGKFGISGAIFANKNDPELQGLLQKFITRFENKFSDKIVAWKGNVREFDDAVHDAEEIFGPLVTIEQI
jgi:MFS family permease